MCARDVSLSDLELARNLSLVLSGLSAPEASTETDGNSRYVRFSAARIQGRPAPAQAATPKPTEPAIEPFEPTRFDSWETLLEWCLGQFPARVAFVVEPEGFVIATWGSWSFSHLEGVGPLLLDINARSSEIEEDARPAFFALQLESHWLNALVIRREGMGDFIVGFFGPEMASGSERTNIKRQIQHNIDNL